MKPQLREFTIEDRMQLSQDLRLLGEKCSEKILNIYKKTEDVQSSDGECEIDFQTMKLVTLHSLREFADKCLQKKRDKQLRKGAVTAGQPGIAVREGLCVEEVSFHAALHGFAFRALLAGS